MKKFLAYAHEFPKCNEEPFCNEFVEVKTVSVDGYHIRERLLDDVLFNVTNNNNQLIVEIDKDSISYLEANYRKEQIDVFKKEVIDFVKKQDIFTVYLDPNQYKDIEAVYYDFNKLPKDQMASFDKEPIILSDFQFDIFDGNKNNNYK